MSIIFIKLSWMKFFLSNLSKKNTDSNIVDLYLCFSKNYFYDVLFLSFWLTKKNRFMSYNLDLNLI